MEVGYCWDGETETWKQKSIWVDEVDLWRDKPRLGSVEFETQTVGIVTGDWGQGAFGNLVGCPVNIVHGSKRNEDFNATQYSPFLVI